MNANRLSATTAHPFSRSLSRNPIVWGFLIDRTEQVCCFETTDSININSFHILRGTESKVTLDAVPSQIGSGVANMLFLCSSGDGYHLANSPSAVLPHWVLWSMPKVMGRLDWDPLP